MLQVEKSKSERRAYRIDNIAMFMVTNVRSNLHKKIHVLGLFIVPLNVVGDDFYQKITKV